MSTTLKVLSAKKVVATHQLNPGDLLVIDARANSNYQLINDQTGLGPENIIVKREGEDLKIFLEDGDMNPDILIQGYYGNKDSEEVSNLLVGQHENGKIYPYIPESGEKLDAVSMLADQTMAPQALGGEELSSPFWAFNPWWLLALVPIAGGILAAKRNENSAAADKPTLSANENGDTVIKAGKNNSEIKVDYVDNKGNTQTVVINKKADGTWAPVGELPKGVTVGKDGTVTVNKSILKPGSELKAQGVTPKGNKSDVQMKGADQPIVEVDEKGTTEIKPGKDNVAVSVDFVDAQGNPQKINAVKNEKGEWTATYADGSPVSNTEKVTFNPATGTITLTKGAIENGTQAVISGKNETGFGADKVLKTADPVKVDSNEAGDAVVIPGEDNTEIKVDFTDEKGEKQQVVVKKDDNGNWKPEGDLPKGVIVDEETGKVTIHKEGLEDGGKVDVSGKNESGTEADNQLKVSDKPEVSSTPAGNAVVKPGNDNTELKVFFTDNKGNPQELVLKQDNGVWKPVDNNGNVIPADQLPPSVKINTDGSVEIDKAGLKEGSDVAAQGKNQEGIESDKTLKVSDKPTITTEPTGDTVVKPGQDNEEVKVDFVGADDKPRSFTLRKAPDWMLVDDEGNPAELPENVRLDKETGELTIPKAAVKDGSDVAATGKNASGTAVSSDLELANEPNVDQSDDKNIVVTPGENNDAMTVEYLVAPETKEAVTVKNVDGKWVAVDEKGEPVENLPEGVKLDAENGTVTLDKDKLFDGSEVKASGATDKGAINQGTLDFAVRPIVTEDGHGGAKVEPGKDNTQVKVEFTDENGKPQTVVINKTPEEKWTVEGTLPQGVSVNDNGEITLEPNAIKDNSDVKATGTNASNVAADKVSPMPEDADKGAEEAVKAAEKAQKDLAKALEDAEKDGLITPEEKANLDKLKQDFDAKKEAADKAVKELPETVKTKEPLQDRVDALKGAQIPDVNDANINGIPDAQEAKIADLVKKAEDADKAAKDALKEAEKDGAISPAEHAKLVEAAKKAADTKAAAQKAVDELPNEPAGVKAIKDGFQGRLDPLDGIKVPDINDKDNNGIPDAQEAKIADLVKKAEDADKAAKDALKEAEKDGAISPAEHAKLVEAAKKAADTKAAAQKAVDELPNEPAGVKAIKDGFQGRLDPLDGIKVPDINDKDNNGIPDAQEAKIADLVKKAEDADKAAKDALKEAEKDGAISPAEHAKLVEAAKKAADTKAAAQKAVDELPNEPAGVKAIKDGFQGRLDPLDGIKVPDINDKDNNGIPDAQEAKIADLVKKAEDADKAAKDALKEAEKDGAISPAEHAKLVEAAKKAADTKAAAQKAVDELPNEPAGVKAIKDGFQGRLDPLDGIKVPDINDKDNNGIPDAQEAKIADLVKKAEDADKAAKDALKEAEKDGAISPAEHAKLVEAAKKAADTKAAAQKAVDELPNEPAGVKAIKDGFQGRLDPLDGIKVPDINDKDNNGIPDAQEAKIADLVKKAEDADKAAKDALKEAEKDGAISPAEHAKLVEAAKKAADTKAAAQKAVDELPNEPAGVKAIKDGFQGRLDPLDGIKVPDINDKDNNGIPDAQEAKIADLVKKAEDADKAAKDALKEAEKDGAISPAEHAKLVEAAKKAADTKAAAQKAVDELPNEPAGVKAIKDGFQGRLDPLDGIKVPDINDKDNNGIPDAQEAKIADLVKKAEDADKAAKDALKEAEKDGAISPAEHAKLVEAAKKAADTKAAAQKAVDELPNEPAGVKAIKDGFQGRLDPLDGIKVPDINDKDNNGIPDAQEAKIADLVKKAEDADKAAKDALRDAKGEDDLITPEERAALVEAKKKADDTKAAAQEAVNALPNEPEAAKGVKDGFQGRLDPLDGIQIPDVNDVNKNGIPDEKELQDAKDLLAKAKAAEKALDDAIAEAQKDGLTPEEVAELQQQAAAADKLKDDAKKAIDALPEGMPEKADLAKRADEIDNTVPAADTDPAKTAKDLLAEAKAKEAALDKAIEDALKDDGRISPEEKAALDAQAKEADAAKKAAQDEIAKLPENNPDKADLTDKANKIDNTVPPVTDADNDGIPDTKELKDAEDLLAKAKAAEKALDDAIAEAQKDGLTPEEVAELQQQAAAADKLKDDAKKAIDALPEGMPEKADLAKRADEIDNTVPAADTDPAKTAKDLLAEAKAKEAALDKAIEDALKDDGRISPEEKAALDAQAKEADAAKKAAQDEIAKLPENNPDKADLTDKANKIDNTVPPVTDADNDGIPDTKELKDAKDLLAKAKAAEKALDDAIAEAQKDGLTPEEVAELQQQAAAADKLKDDAKKAIDALPEGMPEKADLAKRADEIDNTVPAADTDPAKTAKDLLAEAKAKEAALDKAIEDALKDDGRISPEEKAALDAQAKEADAAKKAAQDEIAKLPENNPDKADLTDKANKIDNTVPPVTDADNDGIPDTKELKDAKDLLAKAKAAEKALDDAIAEAQKDGLTPEEVAELQQQAAAADKLKDDAKKAIDALPEGMPEKADLAKRADEIDNTVPAADTDPAKTAKDLLAEAKAKEAALDKAIEDALKDDGRISPEEKAALDAQAKEADAAKKAAQDEIAKLPENNPDKADLTDKANKIDNTVPPVTDADNDGIPDTKELKDAEDLLAKAKAAEKALDDAIAEAQKDGLTPEEVAELQQQAAAADKLKDDAKKAIDALPEGMPEKADLAKRADEIDNTVPAADTDPAKTAKDLLAEAKAKEAALDKAIEDALKDDGRISPEEKAALDAQAKEADAAKKAAQDEIAKLPENNPDKADLTDKANKIDNTVPPVTDADNDGIPDTKELKDAEDLLAKAKAAEKALDDAIAEAQKDGLTPEEVAELQQQAAAADKLKDDAKKAIDALPEGMPEKADLAKRADEIDNTVPPATPEADAPTISQSGEGNQGLTVTPGDNNTKVVVGYTDENGNNQTITMVKQVHNGGTRWVIEPGTQFPEGTTISGGKLVINPNSIKGKVDLTATGESEGGKTAATTGQAESKPANEATIAPANQNIEVTPGADNTKVVVNYTDANNQPQTVTMVKDGTRWVIEPGTSYPEGTTIRGGKFIIPTEKLKDGVTTVTAASTNADNGTAENSYNITPEADAPQVVQSGEGNQGLTVTPGDNNTKVVVGYTDENGNNQTITMVKQVHNGGTRWVIEPGTQFPEGTTISGGKLVINPNSIKGKVDLTATGEAEGGKTAATTGQAESKPADQASIDKGQNVQVTPGADNTKVVVGYTDANNQPQTATMVKDGTRWVIEPGSSYPEGTTISGGKFIIPADKIKDGTAVNATSTNADNGTAEKSQSIDLKTPEVTAITITKNADNYIPANEIADGKIKRVIVNVDKTKTQAGDIIVIETPAGNIEHVVDQGSLNNAGPQVPVWIDNKVPAPAEGQSFTYKAYAKDAEGNTQTNKPATEVKFDTVTPQVTDIIISKNDANYIPDNEVADGKIKRVIVNVDKTKTQAGDIIVIETPTGNIEHVVDQGSLNNAGPQVAVWIDNKVPAPAEGQSFTYKAYAKDKAGNTQTDKPSTEVKAGRDVRIDNYVDDVGDTRGEFLSGSTTDDRTPLLKGSATPNSKVYLYAKEQGGHFVKIAESTANAEGKWDYQVPNDAPLAVREHSFYVNNQDTVPTNVPDADLFKINVASEAFNLDEIFSKPFDQRQNFVAATTLSKNFVAIGDVNGDGRDDMSAISAGQGGNDLAAGSDNVSDISRFAPLITPGATFNHGAAGNFTGQGNAIITHNANLNDHNPNGDVHIHKPGLNLILTLDRERLAVSSANGIGDINGDGLSDAAIIGTQSANIFYGKSYDDRRNKKLVIRADQKGIEFGHAVEDAVASKGVRASSTGDFNGDGFGDVITNNGIFFGSRNGLNNGNKLAFAGSPDIGAVGAAGDVNGDGFADAIVVSKAKGKAYVLFGGTGTTPITLEDDGVTGGNGGFALKVTKQDNRMDATTSVTGIGDFNGDGLSDIVIANPRATGDSNYLVWGKTDVSTVDLDNLGTKGIPLKNGNVQGLNVSGFTDFNGDGLSDFILLNKSATAFTRGQSTQSNNDGSATVFLGGRDLSVVPTHKADQGGTVTGTDKSDFIVGNKGNETLIGSGGADVISAGNGDDTIIINQSNLNALMRSDYAADGRVARIDGGHGKDTLKFANDVSNIDLTQISNAGSGYIKTGIGMSRLSNIEIIDLGKADNQGRTLTLEAKDVLDLSSAQAFTTANKRHQLRVDGDGQDKVVLKASEWANSVGSEHFTLSGVRTAYKVYNQQGTEYGAQLFIDDSIQIQLI